MNELKNSVVSMDDWAAPEIIEASRLFYMDIPPMKYFIDGLLPEGLTILSGDPKVGKSYMAFAISLALAEGRSVWGREGLKCNIIYCCLEDSLSRLKKRLHQLTDRPVLGVHFMMSCMPIGNGLEEDLEYAISVIPNVGMIIIDTLQRVRRGARGNSNAYACDYEELTVLKSFADRHRIGVVCVHHNRKLKSDSDPLSDISGTQGVSGTADTLWVLKKKRRFANRATLYVSGRDVESQLLEMQFDCGKWSVDEQPECELVPSIMYELIDFVAERTAWSGTATSLLQELGNTDLTCHEIGKMLVKYADTVLAEAGITYAPIRSKSQRLITLQYIGDR